MSPALLLILALTQTAPADFLPQGEALGRLVFTARLCGAAGYVVDADRAEVLLVDFETRASSAGLSRGRGADAFDEGLQKEQADLALAGGDAPTADASHDHVTRSVNWVQGRCRHMAEQFPDVISGVDEAEASSGPIIADWFAPRD